MRWLKARILIFILAAALFPKISNAEVWAKIITVPYFAAVLNTPLGLIAGENDSRSFVSPYNGLYHSKNAGDTWNSMGLEGRGITDIAFFNGNLYATTFYKKDGLSGLFRSTNSGLTWEKIGPNFSGSTIAVDAQSVYLGSDVRGVWVSQDGGQNFVQKIGTDGFGPKTFAIRTDGNLVIAGTATKTYKSTDHGVTWQEITALNGHQFNEILFTPNRIFVSSYDNSGIYVSTDYANTWTKLNSFGTVTVGGLAFFEGVLYAGKYDEVTNEYQVFRSSDSGQTWQSTGLDLPSTSTIARDLTWIYGQPSYLVGSFSGEGLHRMEIPPKLAETFRFLDTPWQTSNPADLTDKITSFFDHKFPLLGYLSYSEPAASANTTVNFLGVEASKPELYYSSHSGIDFALPYGTSVIAPADGTASYYFCQACGHTIKLDHLNGYQTIYEHLQSDRLVTVGGSKTVLRGDVLGKVGLTGNTNGAHLHFEVTKDANSNGNFNDDFPQGRIDPFGWLDMENADPWAGYSWNDGLGSHIGQTSKYLWNTDLPEFKSLITPAQPSRSVVYGNKTFELSNIAGLEPYNFKYISYAQPKTNPLQSNLKYLPNSSFLLEMVDTMKNKITTLPNKITITVDISGKDLANVQTETLKLYYYDVIDQTWKSLVTNVDLGNKTLTAETDHLTQFAVFSEAMDSTAPTTTVRVDGNKSGEWFTVFPTITLISDATDLDKIFYSIDDGATWEEYLTPFDVAHEGYLVLLYRGKDVNGNYEDIKEAVIKVNTQGKWTKTIKVSGAIFNF